MIAICVLCKKLDGFDYIEFARWYYSQNREEDPLHQGVNIPDEIDEDSILPSLEQGLVMQLNIALARYTQSAFTGAFVKGMFEALSLNGLYNTIEKARSGELEWNK